MSRNYFSPHGSGNIGCLPVPFYILLLENKASLILKITRLQYPDFSVGFSNLGCQRMNISNCHIVSNVTQCHMMSEEIHNLINDSGLQSTQRYITGYVLLAIDLVLKEGKRTKRAQRLTDSLYNSF